MKHRYILTTLVLGLFPISLFAQTGNFNLNEKIPVDKNIIKGQLDNGFTYYIKANKRPENRAEFTLVVNTGSVYEDEDQQGLAHFCEHMAFNGTKNFPKNELVNYLESIGMKFGPEVNAYTSFDQTVYGIKLPTNREGLIDTGLIILADWAHNVSYDPEEIDKERGVIHEEWRLGRGADERMMQKYLPVILYKSKYAERLPIGKIEIIDNFKHESLLRFYKDWYRPDLMGIIAVGDFDPITIENKIRKIFSNIPKPQNVKKQEIYEIPEHKELLTCVASDKEAQYSTIQIYYKLPLFIENTIADYRKSIVHKLFNEMINNRLNELRQKENPPFTYGYSAYSNFIGPKNAYMSIAIAANDKILIALQTLLEENERIKRFGFTQTELDRTKKALFKEIENTYNERNKIESENFVAEYVRNFGIYKEPIPGIEFEYEMYKKFLPEITLEEVNKLSTEWITEDNQVIIITGPDKENIILPTEKEIRDIVKKVNDSEISPYVDKISNLPLISKLPPAGKIQKSKKNKTLDYIEWTLSNGTKVILKPTNFKDNEILLTAFSNGGYSLYTQKDDISSAIAASVFKESGLGPFDKIELDKKLSDKTITIEPYINELEEGFEASCASSDIETLLQIIHLYFIQPRLSKEAFNSFINKKKAEYENLSASPEATWRDTIKCVKSQYHPRRRPWNSNIFDEADYKRIDKIFRERFADPNNFTFIIVGNFAPNNIKPLIEKYIGSLQPLNRNETWKDLEIRPPTKNIDKTVFKGHENKSYVYISFFGSFDYTDENIVELEILTSILDTKLLETIREDKSETYSITAYPNVKRYPVPLYDIAIMFGCAPENVENITETIMQEIEILKTKGPSQNDLNKAKEKKLREHEIKIKENKFWIEELKNIYQNITNENNYTNFEKYVKNISAEQIKQAAVKYFNTNIRVVLKPEAKN